MNIAFDGTAILGPMSKNRGIGNYALSQFTTMINMDKKNNYFFLNFIEKFDLSSYLTDANNFTETYFYCGKNNFMLKNKEYEELIGDIIKNFIKENKIDIFYITSPFESSLHVYKKEWFNNVKVISTVYDIIPYVLKDEYLTDKNTYKWYMQCIDMLKWVDKCFVISESVKEDMVRYLDFDQDKIIVIYGAVDKTYKPIDISKNRKENLFLKFGIKGKYIMCTGGDDSRKNIKELIVAYSRMNKELINVYQLVIVCKLSEKAVIKYTKVIKDNNVEGRVILTNFVSNEELLLLYNLAYLMAFPSKYEGFGLPVVEAFACGTPVLTSNNSSLGEIARDASILVDPYNTEDITRGLNEALINTDLKELAKKGFERLKLYQWETVAEISIKGINSINVNTTDMFVEKKRLAFFSPMPPIKSGISDYSVDILNSISDYFDIDVYVDDNYKIDCTLNDNIYVYNHKFINKNHKKYYDIIYQVGNSEYHKYMWPYIKDYKGTVVLHDYNLHLYIQHYTLYLGKNNFKLYKQFLLEDFDEGTVNKYINDLKDGATKVKSFEMELNGFVINYANKIIVHSDEAREKLLARDIYRNVKTIASYAKIEPLIDNADIKSSMNIENSTIIMASFGHVQETKRVMPILNAFNKLVKKYNNVKFIFVGELDATIRHSYEKFVRDNEIGDKVSITGYVEIGEFIRYIDLADVCFNLRYPYNGETSGSLMRLLAKGKCVVVNDIGSFGEIPDKCCIKLPNVIDLKEDREIDAIYNSMNQLMIMENRVELSKNARAFAEENLDIDIITKAYYNFIIEKGHPSITEKMIANIIDRELSDKNYNNFEILELSKTLGYSKNYKKDMRIDNVKINVESIMSEIRRDIKSKGE